MEKRILATLVALMCLLGALASANAEAGVSVTDMAGHAINLAAPAERIVVLSPSDCEILFALGAGDKVVARGTYCNYPAEALALPDVESGAETNVEQILALEPDVVVMSLMAQREEQLAAFESAGVSVVVTDGQSIETAYQEIELMGAISGKTAEAQAMIDDMKASFEALKTEANGGGKSVYFEVSPLEYGLWTAGSGTFMNELAEMAGLVNAFADITGWAEVSQEQVLERDPDYIVTIAMYFGEGLKPEDEIIAREGWQNLKAVKNGAVLNVDSDQISRPGPRLVDALRELVKLTQ